MKKLIAYLVFVVLSLPIIMPILLSIFSYYRYPQLFPSRFTLTYWENFFFRNPLMFRSVLTSMGVGLLNAILSTLVGFMAGRALAQQKAIHQSKLLLIYSVPLFIPATALFIGIHLMMIRLSLNNTYAGVILSHMILSIPYSTNIAISFFQGIPKDMEHVAQTLGANDIHIFKKIIMPLIMPGLVFSCAICFLLSFSDYLAAVLVGGGKVITLSTLLYPFINQADYGHSAVLGLVFVVINGGIFFIAEALTRRLTKVRTYLFE